VRHRVWIIASAALAATLAGCAGRQPPARADLVAEPGPCGPRRFEVYFEEGRDRLTPPALQAIGLTATELQGCTIRRASVLGLADATGDSETNMALSRRRAEAVAGAFEAAGWPRPVFELAAAGDAGAMRRGTEEPLRRRTEVVIDAVAR
jgi:outer membrane protein OmpA-like peptidoglycan-associated protein